MLILQEAPSEGLDKSTKRTCREGSAAEGAPTKRASSECGSKSDWWRTPAGIRWERVLIYLPLMKSEKTFHQGERDEVWDSGTTKTARTRGACTVPQEVQCGNGWESREIKYLRFRTNHLVKLNLPGKKPTMPVSRNK